MQQGWTFNEIDEINDIHFYFEVMSREEEKPEAQYIDQIPW
jgi:hypothetical protein